MQIYWGRKQISDCLGLYMRLRTKCEQVQENFWGNENVLQLDYGDGYKTIDLPKPNNFNGLLWRLR